MTPLVETVLHEPCVLTFRPAARGGPPLRLTSVANPVGLDVIVTDGFARCGFDVRHAGRLPDPAVVVGAWLRERITPPQYAYYHAS
ncbi:hypothetical protein ABZS66_12055 [Dactylosporangium sp. NPDC005572]|uniref:hypothetical protein n=1 Tax=Dactylosporangium sp. NPDC005572 TaxID=3156889 RepID=UPI0033A2BF52